MRIFSYIQAIIFNSFRLGHAYPNYPPTPHGFPNPAADIMLRPVGPTLRYAVRIFLKDTWSPRARAIVSKAACQVAQLPAFGAIEAVLPAATDSQQGLLRVLMDILLSRW